MINSVTGNIRKITKDYILLMTSSGIEFQINVSLNASEYFRSLENKENARILTYLQHREDGVTLFGFMNEDERSCFIQLLDVSGIGVKVALKVLSYMTVGNLVKALDSGDINTLSRIPGIGKKNAGNMILKLRNVLVLDDNSESVLTNSFTDLIQSFTDMGYERKLVQRAVETVMSSNPDLIAGKSLRDAEASIFPLVLKELSR